MNSVWICNASPLIALSRIGRLDVLAVLRPPLLVPATVLAEVDAGQGRDEAGARLRASGLIDVVADVAVPERVVRWQLDAGEAQVLARALASPGAGVVLDDRAGRRCARLFGLPLTGTLGVVALAKRHGRIPAAAPVLAKLLEAGLFIAPALLAGVLAELGEQPPE